MTDRVRPVTLNGDALSRLRRVSTATLTSELLIRGFRNVFLSGVRPLRPDLRMVGYAFTLRYVPTREDVGFAVNYDNARDIQRLAVELVGPEDVLMIDARGKTTAASFGHIIASRLVMRGAAGIVTDGALRDTAGFAGLDLPSYCRAAHGTTSSVLHHPIDMHVPIGCADVLVMPGDVVVGDAEGVVVIPAGVAEEVANDAAERELREEFALEKVQAGRSIRGIYPLEPESQAEYESWLRSRS